MFDHRELDHLSTDRGGAEIPDRKLRVRMYNDEMRIPTVE
jgi:hypothetical protein